MTAFSNPHRVCGRICLFHRRHPQECIDALVSSEGDVDVVLYFKQQEVSHVVHLEQRTDEAQRQRLHK